jgi:sugar/nucleoside kinase (ribokinase family)
VSDVVVAGHVSLDLRPRLYGPPQIGPGRLVVVGPVAISTGGAVTNTGLALHRLGVDVRLAGKVGDDLFGRALLDELEAIRPGLAADMIVTGSEVTSYTIVIEPPGADRSFLHCPGANESFAAQDVRYDQLDRVRLFHFGYPPLMPRMYADGGAELAEMFSRVRAAGPATSLDMCVPDPDSDAGSVDWNIVLERALPHVDVFAPSIGELLFMVDRPTYERVLQAGIVATVDRALLRRCSDRLIALGATVVAIKLGDQGLYIRTTTDAARIGQLCARAGLNAEEWVGREVLSPCFVPRELAAATGSGDATIAGLLAALLRGADPIDAATAATAVGACSVEALDPTSGIPEWRAVARRIDNGWERAAIALELGPARPTSSARVGTLDLRQ